MNSSKFLGKDVVPVILCGGVGTRLWPLSRELSPKQFAPLVGESTLFDLTINRVKNFSFPICITNELYRFIVKDALSAHFNHIDKPIFLEPEGRNTAASMAISLLGNFFADSDLLLFLPSDHFIPDDTLFFETILSGINAAKEGYIVTFGVEPTFPSAAYGYIQKGDKLHFDGDGPSVAHKVNCFFEKPQVNDAQKMILNGNFLWNMGIFLCKASVLEHALKKYANDIYNCCQRSLLSPEIDGDFIRPNKDTFLSCRSESVDYAVIEKFNKVAVVPYKGTWSDVGSWNALAGFTSPDEDGNRISGKGLVFDSSNTYINASNRTIVALGVSNLIIADSPDALLVASADKVEQVKNVVASLKECKANEALSHRRVLRPWGWYDLVNSGEGFQVKHILVKPGGKLSLQKHKYRSEHWVVVRGAAKVTNGDNEFVLNKNQSVFIEIGIKHRLENPYADDLEMVEVQVGDYLGEDDIVRFEDSYNRA